MDYGSIIGSLAAALAALAILLVRLHGRSCTRVQKDYASKSDVNGVAEQLVPRSEFIDTVASMHSEINEQTKQLRREIHEGYRHIELRIDSHSKSIHERIDRLNERRASHREDG